MTYPRAHLVDPNGGVYHINTRCVRRAFLCGRDPVTGANYEHRRDWVERLILHLADYFAVEVYSYAVMSNHYHIVLRHDPAMVDSLSDSEIVDRWLALCPIRRKSREVIESRRLSILRDSARIQKLRARIASLSSYMQFLNERVARRANREDGCKGRFWESRFNSQRILDERATVACMVYVDLNPVRAGMVDDPTLAGHTSLALRLRRCGKVRDGPLTTLRAGSSDASLPLNLTLEEYIELVNWTMDSQRGVRRSPRPRTRGVGTWLRQLMPVPGTWQRALGDRESLEAYAREIGQRWIRTVARAV